MTPEKDDREMGPEERPGEASLEKTVRDLRDEYWQSIEGDRERRAKDFLQYVSFAVSGQIYAIAIDQVKEVTLMPGISKVPRSPEHLAGVINLRGRIVPLLDLRPLLGVSEREILGKFRVLIVKGGGLEVGLIVEKILGILEAEPADVRVRSAVERAEEAPYVSGQLESADHITTILDAEKLIATESARLRGEVS